MNNSYFSFTVKKILGEMSKAFEKKVLRGKYLHIRVWKVT
jgi:hypothetical protein